MKNYTLLYTNDFHSHIPESLKTINALYARKENSLIIDTGDFSEGHPFYTFFKGEPEKKILSNVFDVVSPGNHGLRELIELNQDNFPIINCHLFYNGHLLFRPSHIIQMKDCKLAFVGIMSKESFDAVELPVRRYLNFEDPNKILPDLLSILRQKVDRIVLLSHSGFEHDKKIAEKYHNKIDVILSGHCHSNNTQIAVNNTLVTKAPELGEGFGELTFQGNQIHNKIIGRDEINLKKNYLTFLSPFLEKYENEYAEDLFYISKEFSLKYSTRKNLMEYLVRRILSDFNSDMCIINYHCLRDVLPFGKITLSILHKCMPFGTILAAFSIEKSSINRYLKQMPIEMWEFLCVSTGSGEKYLDTIRVVTTEYLLLNYFQSLPISQEEKLGTLSDYAINHFSRI